VAQQQLKRLTEELRIAKQVAPRQIRCAQSLTSAT
jgi:hypothetical protein